MDGLPKIDFANIGGSQYIGDFTTSVKDVSSKVVNSINFGLIGTILEIILTLYCLFFICIIVYSIIRINEIKARNKGRIDREIEKYAQLHRGQ
jgi:hypothetical protein